MSVELLRKAPLFAGLSGEDLELLDRMAERVHLDPGEELFREGSRGDRAFILLEGQLEVVKTSGGRPVVLSVRREPGDLIGEMALLEKTPRMATVRALTESRLLAIPQAQFDEMLSSSPSAARAMFRTVISRWRDTEGMIRQSEKMVQLGTLTAGVAHELNNPAAAVVRSAAQLREALQARESLPGALPEDLRRLALDRAEHPPVMDSLERADREEMVRSWLEAGGLEDAADLAPPLTAVGYEPFALSGLRERFPGREFADVVRGLCAAVSVHGLLKEVIEGTRRISDIVGALRSYTFLDQAPLQGVDIHEGLENTLLILGHKLTRGVEVRKEYAPDLPRIQAYGSELNQVWTNIIANAADAIRGKGRIRIRTHRDGEHVAVEIEDDGPGIPEGIRERVFDPFFTTKPPGEGTGLGLHICYNVVVNRHRGEISVSSRPGSTCFRVRLPSRHPS